jgi:hypothetical protein
MGEGVFRGKIYPRQEFANSSKFCYGYYTVLHGTVFAINSQKCVALNKKFPD